MTDLRNAIADVLRDCFTHGTFKDDADAVLQLLAARDDVTIGRQCHQHWQGWFPGDDSFNAPTRCYCDLSDGHDGPHHDRQENHQWTT